MKIFVIWTWPLGNKILDGSMVLMGWPKLVAKTLDIKLCVLPRSTNTNVSFLTITPSMQITIRLCVTIHSNMATNTWIGPSSFALWFFFFFWFSLGAIRPKVGAWWGLFGHWKDWCSGWWQEKHKPLCLWFSCYFSLSLGGVFDIDPTPSQGFQTSHNFLHFPLWA